MLQTNFDLRTDEGRENAISNLNLSCAQALRELGFEASPKIDCELSRDYLHIKPYKGSWIGEVTISSTQRRYGLRVNPPQINFGGSGPFTPENGDCYWRVIHAASALKLWDKIAPFVDKWCAKYEALETEIFNQNK